MNIKLIKKNLVLKTILIPLTLFFLGIILGACNQKVSVTPPDTPPPDGYTFVNSYPEGFQIYLNGQERRRSTPDSLTWLKPGTYQITLKKEFFRDTSFMVNVVEGEKKSTYVDFSKDPWMLGNIICSSQPDSAEIFINDSSTGKITPATLNNIMPGYYKIRYHLKNHLDDSIKIAVSSGKSSSITKLILVDTTLWHDYTTKNSPIATDNLTCITVDKKNVIWTGTSGFGVISFDGITWGGEQLFSILPSSNVNCITVNKNDTLFIGTNRGFVTYDGFSKHMYGFRTSGLPNYWVNAIGFDNSDTWYIGTQGGLTASNGTAWFTYNFETIPDTFITTIFSDNSGNLWIGMKNKGIIKRANNNWKSYYANGASIINNYVRAITESPLGEIWVGFGKLSGSGGGLSYYDGNVWQNVYVLPPASQTNAILIDKNNVKWVATDQGLVRFTNNADVTVFNHDNTGLNINDVTGVAQDSRGNIWISTNGAGLVEYKGNH